MIFATLNNLNRIIGFIQPTQKPKEPQSVLVVDICDNSSYDEGPLDVWTDSDEKVVAL